MDFDVSPMEMFMRSNERTMESGYIQDASRSLYPQDRYLISLGYINTAMDWESGCISSQHVLPVRYMGIIQVQDWIDWDKRARSGTQMNLDQRMKRTTSSHANKDPSG